MSQRRAVGTRSQILEDIHVHSVNMDTREIFLHGYIGDGDEEPGVDWRMGAQFTKNIRYLESLSKDSILIHMHTIGGSWNDGMAIYDSIRASQCYITILAYAHARSMSSIILQAADRRAMMLHADFMIHYGDMTLDTNTTSALTFAEWQKQSNWTMLELYAAACKQAEYFKEWSHSKIISFLDRKMKDKQEWYLTAQDAVKYGFADGVLGDETFPSLAKLREAA